MHELHGVAIVSQVPVFVCKQSRKTVVWVGAFSLAIVADTLNHSSSASVSANLLFLMADYVAVMRSTSGICSGATAKFSPLAGGD